MDQDLNRLRDDLATMRVAAGFDPVWNRHAIRTHALLAAAGAAAAAFATIPHGLPAIFGMSAFVVPVADWLWQARRPDRTAADDREWRQALAVLWYALPLIAVAWWTRIVGLDRVAMVGLMCFMVGFALFGSAVSERRVRPLLGWAIAFMAGGLLAPLYSGAIVQVIGLAISIGALTSLVWIAAQLKRANVA